MDTEVKEEFKQVCVWPGCVVGPDKIREFCTFMQEQFSVRVKYLEEIITQPDTDSNGYRVPDTGGRNDLLFSVHNEDAGKFAVPRLMAGIRWVEDVLAECNYRSPIYPKRIFEYCSWNKEYLSHFGD